MKLKEVFKKSIVMQLRDMCFRIMDAKVNFEHPKFVIYYFEDTKEFRQAFDKKETYKDLIDNKIKEILES